MPNKHPDTNTKPGTKLRCIKSGRWTQLRDGNIYTVSAVGQYHVTITETPALSGWLPAASK